MKERVEHARISNAGEGFVFLKPLLIPLPVCTPAEGPGHFSGTFDSDLLSVSFDCPSPLSVWSKTGSRAGTPHCPRSPSPKNALLNRH